ncbi:MAG: C40 family peptidase [Armatimonadota bacterium]
MARFLKVTAVMALVLALAGQCRAGTDMIVLSLETPELDSTSSSAASKGAPATETKRQQNQVRVGKVGVVAAAKATIYQSRSAKSSKYADVNRETPLAIIREEGPWYGVLMINGAIGWISKHLVRLTGYELVADRSAGMRGIATSRGGDASRGTMIGDGIVRTALGYSGVRYVYGGTDPATGMDCSAFVRMVFGQFGINLPRTAREQAEVGTSVPFDQLQPGDRLYFQCKNGYIDHCGIYAGNGYFVHCSASRGGVAVDSLDSDFYWKTLVAARRSLAD